MADKKQSVAFIGTGIMGAPIAGHILDAGYPVTVYNRTAAKAQPLLERGAVWAETAADAVRGADAFVGVSVPENPSIESSSSASDRMLPSERFEARYH